MERCVSRSERDCVGADDGVNGDESALSVDDRPGVMGRRTAGDGGPRSAADGATVKECSGEEASDVMLP